MWAMDGGEWAEAVTVQSLTSLRWQLGRSLYFYFPVVQAIKYKASWTLVYRRSQPTTVVGPRPASQGGSMAALMPKP